MRAALIGTLGLMGAVLTASAPAAPPVPVRGLSPQDVEDLRLGRGLGMARAADLAGYPGPRHVLDLADAGRLALPPEQRDRVQALFDRMSAEARRLGAAVLDEEAGLERAFGDAVIDDEELTRRVRTIGVLRTELRRVHLEAHLQTRALLDAAQLARYRALRGAPAHTH